MGYKAYSDTYLMSLTKAEIIELLRVAEHNFFSMEEALNNSAKAGMKIAEKFDKAKELLKLAVEDFETIESNLEYDEHCVIKTHSIRCDECPLSADTIYRCKWRYTDEALKLIES